MTIKKDIATSSKNKEDVDKTRNVKQTLFRLASYLKLEHKLLFAVAIFAVLSTVFNVLSPKLLGDATTSIYSSVVTGTSVDFHYIGSIILILLFLYFLSSLFSFLQQYIMAGVSQRIIALLRKKVNEKLTRLPIEYFDKHSHGDLLSRAVNDIDNISASFQQGLSQILSSVVTVLGIIIMMIIISPILTIVVLITIPLSFLIIRFISSLSQKYFKGQQDVLGQVNGHVEEMYSGHQVVKAFGYEEKSIKRFDELNESLYTAGQKAQFISGIMMPLTTFVGNLGFVFISIVGGILVLNGNIPIGSVQAFIQYSQQITHPMSQIASIANIIQNAIASADRIFALLDEKEEERERGLSFEVGEIEGNVTFEDIGFGYNKQLRLIDNLNIQVEKGQTVAIVGPTGAGKTTLINLLLRFYEINNGQISVDGVDLHKLSREQARSMFAMVLQDTWLFSGTIRENIAYGKKGATFEEIKEAAISAHADEFIRTLPDGYDTILNQGTTNISQGQKQLLTIARAIISNPKILILDEATSSVDTRTELKIQKAMNKLMKNRTSFIIAHRLSTIKQADLILVMDKGKIIEKGTHQQLLAHKGFYERLYNSQFDRKEVSI